MHYFINLSDLFVSASFHPLTNRKHHCRLCGRIICSLPAKLPQRPIPCSLLFVADTKAGRIEEVSETVDYGVKRPGAGKKGDVDASKCSAALRDDLSGTRGTVKCNDESTA